jgi:hypothetical protein
VGLRWRSLCAAAVWGAGPWLLCCAGCAGSAAARRGGVRPGGAGRGSRVHAGCPRLQESVERISALLFAMVFALEAGSDHREWDLLEKRVCAAAFMRCLRRFRLYGCRTATHGGITGPCAWVRATAAPDAARVAPAAELRLDLANADGGPTRPQRRPCLRCVASAGAGAQTGRR